MIFTQLGGYLKVREYWYPNNIRLFRKDQSNRRHLGNDRKEIDFFSLFLSIGRSLSRYRELDSRQTWLTEWQTNACIERRAGCTRLTTRGRCVAYRNRFDRYIQNVPRATDVRFVFYFVNWLNFLQTTLKLFPPKFGSYSSKITSSISIVKI